MRVNRTGTLSGNKIKSLFSLKPLIKRLKEKGGKIVFTNGCFDLLHYGHVKYLEEAKAKGDYLVVAVNSDSSLRKIKGKERPINSQADRLRLIGALACVDFVILFPEINPLKLIKALKPDILIKGADWKKADIVGGEFVRGYGGKVITIRLVKGRSTTGIIRKIVKIFS